MTDIQSTPTATPAAPPPSTPAPTPAESPHANPDSGYGRGDAAVREAARVFIEHGAEHPAHGTVFQQRSFHD